MSLCSLGWPFVPHVRLPPRTRVLVRKRYGRRLLAFSLAAEHFPKGAYATRTLQLSAGEGRTPRRCQIPVHREEAGSRMPSVAPSHLRDVNLYWFYFSYFVNLHPKGTPSGFILFQFDKCGLTIPSFWI